ncbi:MAG: GNAT family N-acetyltransferase [Thermoanaerobaculia bacterium]
MKAHFILYVGDQRRSTEFYAGVLATSPQLDVPGMTEFALPGGSILGLMPESGIVSLLGAALPDPQLASGIPRSELYLVVPEALPFIVRAMTIGARLLSPLQRRDWGHSAGYLLDPDGHVLAFAEEPVTSVREAPSSGERTMTDEVLLRDVVEDDLPVFFEQQRDPAANEMAAFPARERAAFMEHWARIAGDATAGTKTVVFRGNVAGNVVSWVLEGERSVGYWLGREFWGQGIATRALAQFLQLEPARPLYARVAKSHIASLRVLEKCGFTICGETKDVSSESGVEVAELVLKLG